MKMNAIINLCGWKGELGYPSHTHQTYEIIYYLEGEGILKTAAGNLPFSAGSIAVIPPEHSHATTSKAGFRLFALRAEFGSFFAISEPLMTCDVAEREAEALIKMIYRNRTDQGEYFSSILASLANFILKHSQPADELTRAVRKAAIDLAENFYIPNISPATILKESGYSEDYIRAQFKKIYEKTPGEFLTELRIEHAKHLIHVYGSALPLLEIAERCGFADYTYFSQKFKEVVGQSPRHYRKEL